MRIMLKTVLALCLIASVATAKTAPEKPDVIYLPNSAATEIEPNGDHLTATPFLLGDDMSGAIAPAAELDYFSVVVSAGDHIVFETHPGDIFDTKLYLYDVDGTTQLAFNDDGGQNWYSLIDHTFATAGTYFVMVKGYNTSTTGTYVLTATVQAPPPPAPANDVCEGAIDIQEQSLAVFDVDLLDSGYTNGVTMGLGTCTGYSSNAPEAFYKIYLTTGESFTAYLDGPCDMSLYMFTDCADPVASCVVGSDTCCSGSQESITYEATADGWYFMGVDGYSTGCIVTVSIDAPVATSEKSWGSLKSLFR